MTERGTNDHIKRPPEKVFRYLIEPNDAGRRSGVLGMRLAPGSNGGAGSDHVERRKVPGREIEARAEVVIYEPDRRGAVRRATGPARPQVTCALEPARNGPRLVFEREVPVLKGAARLLDPRERLGARSSRRPPSKTYSGSRRSSKASSRTVRGTRSESNCVEESGI